MKALDLARLLRPYQWSKNAFVLAGVLFANRWTDRQALSDALWMTLAFCLLASAVYIGNDLLDLEADRLHPQKQKRPLASGQVSERSALLVFAILAGVGISLGAWVSLSGLLLLTGYATLNFLYTLWLKHVAFLDVSCLAGGFLIRVLAGTIAIGIPPSPWILVCSSALALFLGFCKRRAEAFAVAAGEGMGRKALDQYPSRLLDAAISVSGLAALFAYALYCFDASVQRLHQTDRLPWTIPFVGLGLWRYAHLVYKRRAGEDTTSSLFRDPNLLALGAAWLGSVWWILS